MQSVVENLGMSVERRFNGLLLGYGLPIGDHEGFVSPHDLNASWAQKRETYLRLGIRDEPTNRTIHEDEFGNRLTICYFSYDNGRFLVQARDRVSAYRLAAIVRGYYSIFIGWSPTIDPEWDFVRELTRMPEPGWTIADLLHAHDPEIHPESVRDGTTDTALLNATGVLPSSLPGLVDFVSVVTADHSVSAALDALTFSRRLFDGFMVPSYWESHYRRDVQELSAGQREKAYLDNRIRYESAFLSAFRAIEHLLHAHTFSKRQVENLVKGCGYESIAEDPYYSRLFEVFVGKPETAKMSELIGEFLDMRNASAAHGNRTPPTNLRVGFDSVYEIQELVTTMIDHAADSLISVAKANETPE